jgi:hypothetical protein
MDRKMSTSTEQLCKGYPTEFRSYFEYCRSLRFEDRPDYAYLKRLFKELFYRKGFQYDNMFDWTILNLQQEKARMPVERPLGQGDAGEDVPEEAGRSREQISGNEAGATSPREEDDMGKTKDISQFDETKNDDGRGAEDAKQRSIEEPIHSKEEEKKPSNENDSEQ